MTIAQRTGPTRLGTHRVNETNTGSRQGSFAGLWRSPSPAAPRRSGRWVAEFDWAPSWPPGALFPRTDGIAAPICLCSASDSSARCRHCDVAPQPIHALSDTTSQGRQTPANKTVNNVYITVNHIIALLGNPHFYTCVTKLDSTLQGDVFKGSVGGRKAEREFGQNISSLLQNCRIALHIIIPPEQRIKMYLAQSTRNDKSNRSLHWAMEFKMIRRTSVLM